MKPEYTADDALSRRIFRNISPDDTSESATHQPFSRTAFTALQKENERLKQTLRLSSGLQQRFEELYDASPLGLLSLDADNHIIEINLTLARLLGIRKSALIGRRLETVVTTEDYNTLSQHLAHVREQASSSPTSERFPLCLIDAKSQKIEAHLECTPVPAYLSPDLPIIRIKVYHDSIQQPQKKIDDIKLAKEKSPHQQDDLAHTARLTTVGEMASGLAHEITQPLTAIISYSQSCLKLLQGDEQKWAQVPKGLKQINMQARLAANIVKHLRDFVTKSQPHRESTELGKIVRLAVSMMRTEIIKHQVKFRIDSPSSLPAINADPIQIEQVTLNLLRNAIEAMTAIATDSRRLLITMGRASPTHLFVAISDTGPGITREHQDDLSSPFFSTKENGMGLGLAICRTIVEDHGGQLTHSLNPDGGMTFTFTLDIGGTQATAE